MLNLWRRLHAFTQRYIVSCVELNISDTLISLSRRLRGEKLDSTVRRTHDFTIGVRRDGSRNVTKGSRVPPVRSRRKPGSGPGSMRSFVAERHISMAKLIRTDIRAVRRRIGGRRRRWVVLWPAASDRMREHWNSALAGQAFFPDFTGVSHFTCDIRWAAGTDKLTVNMHAVYNFTIVMS